MELIIYIQSGLILLLIGWVICLYKHRYDRYYHIQQLETFMTGAEAELVALREYIHNSRKPTAPMDLRDFEIDRED